MPDILNIAVLGGDLRQIYIANHLCESGYSVVVYGTVQSKLLKSICVATSLSHALNICNVIVCPTPFSKNNTHLFTENEEISISNTLLEQTLNQDHFVVGGDFPNEFTNYCKFHQIEFYDFLKDDSIAIENAVATAEGAIAMAIQSSLINLSKSRCLVLGFGRCGKILAHKLSGFQTKLTISTRNSSSLSYGHSLGYDVIQLSELKYNLPQFDYIFNTIPSVILPKELLAKISPETTIIDIASAPGGLDYGYVKKHHLNAHLCLGIPGKISPKTTGIILSNALIQKLKERSD